MDRPELIAPAGNLKKLKYAVEFGADAVYCGVPSFSLRQRINDFDLKSLRTGIDYAHKLGKKVYVTLNIVAHEKHLAKLAEHIKWLKAAKPDALVVSDPGVLTLIKKLWPSAEIHLSTQANCTNSRTVKFWAKQGVRRIILAREVTLAEIKKIHKAAPHVELEYFVHGAMCMSYSGRCLLSKFFTDRSANLGDCTQPCRWQYAVCGQQIPKHLPAMLCIAMQAGVRDDTGMLNAFHHQDGRIALIKEDEQGSYIMNSRDLCLVEYLQDLKKAGVTSFKIEGRAKSIYYVAVVTKVYRAAIDGAVETIPSRWAGRHELSLRKRQYVAELKKCQNRGFTTGFLFGKEECEQKVNASHEKCEWEFCGEIIDGKVKVHNQIFVGDRLELVPPIGANISYKVKKMYDDKMNEISEAHGGQNAVVYLPMKKAPEMTLIRRRVRE